MKGVQPATGTTDFAHDGLANALHMMGDVSLPQTGLNRAKVTRGGQKALEGLLSRSACTSGLVDLEVVGCGGLVVSCFDQLPNILQRVTSIRRHSARAWFNWFTAKLFRGAFAVEPCFALLALDAGAE